VPAPVRRAATWWFSPDQTVEDRMFSWLAVLRLVLLAHAVALNVYRRDNFVHPLGGVVCLALMGAWTFFAIWAYDRRHRRTPLLLGADLATALGAILVSPVLKGDGLSATVPAFWVMGALLAWAIEWRSLGGLVAGVAITVCDLAIRAHVSQANYGNAFLLLVGGPIVGFMVESLQRMAAERDLAQREAAAAAERARLARAVHDGVAQDIASLGYLVDTLRVGVTSPEQAERIDMLRDRITAVVAEIRRSVVTLRTSVGQSESLGTAIGSIARNLSEVSGVPIHVTLDEHTQRLRGEVEAELFRIAQEAMNNAVRHAQPSLIEVRCVVHAPEAMITSRSATLSDSPPHEPTRTIDCTSYWSNSSLT